MRSPALAQRIVHLLDIGPHDRVLEIGPGPGALSGFLRLAGPGALVLLEKDAHWAAERQRANEGQAVIMDALRLPWERITSAWPWKLIGNLPYNIASPLIWDAVSLARGLTRAVFMVQKEVALRIAAPPGGKSYGALSVWVQSFVSPKIAFSVGPGMFNPPPKVDSAVIVLTPLPPGQRADRPEELARLLRLCFQNRRKQLQTIFKQNKMEHALHVLQDMKINPQNRPETLSPLLFQELSSKLY